MRAMVGEALSEGWESEGRGKKGVMLVVCGSEREERGETS